MDGPGPASATATAREIRGACLCLATQRAARRLARRFDRAFAPLGLTNQQFSMMVALSGSWGPRMGELAAFLDMDPTTLTAAMKPLERRDLVVQRRDGRDARARRPALTEAGRALLAQAVPVWRAAHASLESSLAPGLAGALVRDLDLVPVAPDASPPVAPGTA